MDSYEALAGSRCLTFVLDRARISGLSTDFLEFERTAFNPWTGSARNTWRLAPRRSSVISLSLTKLLLVDLVFGAKSGSTARRAPAQQDPGRTGIDHAVFGDTTLCGAVAADVLPLELTRRMGIGID
jgi:hypothetical protein